MIAARCSLILAAFVVVCVVRLGRAGHERTTRSTIENISKISPISYGGMVNDFPVVGSLPDVNKLSSHRPKTESKSELNHIMYWKQYSQSDNDSPRNRQQQSPTNIHSPTNYRQHSQNNEATSSQPQQVYNDLEHERSNNKRQLTNRENISNKNWFVTSHSMNIFSGCPLENNGTVAQCSCMNLTEVPTDNIPYNITVFDLHNNSITILKNKNFIQFIQLKRLDLSSNRIYVMEEGAFSDLGQLEWLSLWGNQLSMTKSNFPDTIFSSLVRLQELKINMNNGNCNGTHLVYPDEALSRLTSLRSLHMDGLPDQNLGPGFEKLTNLVDLTMAGYIDGCCYINSLDSTFFQYVPHLQYLNISDCAIHGGNVEPGVFSNLQNLTSLDLTHNEDIDIENVNNVFHGLRNITSLRYLYMNLIINRYSIGICLDSEFIKYIPQNLEYLEARENTIEGLDRHVLKILPKTLKTLDVSGNKFVFGTYLQDLPLMTNLEILRLNRGSFIYNLPNLYPYHLTQNRATTSNCSLYGLDDDVGHIPFILKLPPKLQQLEMIEAGLTYKLTELIVDPNNTLWNLSLRGNYFPELKGPFVGLTNLSYLDLSSSYVGKIFDTFFVNLTSLETLKLNENLLGDFFVSCTCSQLFTPLANLTLMDLSFNYISVLNEDIFGGLYKLKTLLLHKNALTKFGVHILHMWDLTYVNISRNRIPNLLRRTQQHIDDLLSHGRKFTIDMAECPIACNCGNYQFLSWMVKSRAFNRSFPMYVCYFQESLSQRITDGYNSTIADLVKQCASNKQLFLCVALVMCFSFCVIFSSVLYRFRWKIRYLYYAAHVFYKTSQDRPNTQFDYDAFISYDQEDEQFVTGKLSHELEKRGLKLYIHGRDFRAGEYIASNVVRAVCVSRRTVVVLTRHMMHSYWCGYEIQMANMESVHSGRKVLIFLLMEALPDSELGMELLYHIRNNTYIPYPDPLPDATSMGRLWDKLAADIRD